MQRMRLQGVSPRAPYWMSAARTQPHSFRLQPICYPGVRVFRLQVVCRGEVLCVLSSQAV